MSGHLKLVGKETPKPPRRRKKKRYYETIFTADEQRRAKAAFLGLRDAFGTMKCLADAMGTRYTTLWYATSRGRITAALVYAAAKASGMTFEDILGAPALAGVCRSCGQVKRRAS
jgi:hypothetical protein